MKATELLEKRIEEAGTEGLSFHVACKAMEEYAEKTVDELEDAVLIIALLVRCKEIKDSAYKTQAEQEFYDKCKPLAWENAKEFLSNGRHLFPKWIPVGLKTTLPAFSEWIGYTSEGNTYKVACDRIGKLDSYFLNETEFITHIQPLPKPPKDE